MSNGRDHDRNQMTRHHMVPRSRGGTDKLGNIKMVSAKKHEAWHMLFGNMTPDEIIQHIQDEWTPRERQWCEHSTSCEVPI